MTTLLAALGPLAFMLAAPLLCATDFMRSIRRELRCHRQTRAELVNGEADLHGDDELDAEVGVEL